MNFTMEQLKEHDGILRDMPLILDRLHRAGLHETARAFHEGPLKKLGYEVAAARTAQAKQLMKSAKP